MPSDYTKFIFELIMSDVEEYNPRTEYEKQTKEFAASALNCRSREDINVPISPAVVTIAIGTETVVGLFVKNTGAKSIIVKWTQNAKSNEQKLGEVSPAADNGEWMFVPKVDSSSNITLEADTAVSTAHVKVIHN